MNYKTSIKNKLVLILFVLPTVFATQFEIPKTDQTKPDVAGVNNPVSISMQYYVLKNKQKYIALAGYSDNITYRQARFGDNPIEWGVRYRDAITNWQIESLPSNGALYFEGSILTLAPVTITNPDALLYVPNVEFTGTDKFSFSVTDSNGVSGNSVVSLIVKENITLPKGIPSMPAIFYTAPPVPASSGNTESDDWYIDNSHPNATDTVQPGESDPRHGTPDFPRLTLPPNNSTFVAGARVFFAGGVDVPYTLRNGVTWHRWFIPGTAENPVYIIGVNNGPNKPIITGTEGKQLRLQVQHAIFEGLEFKGVGPVHRVGQAEGNIVFRHVLRDGMNRGTTGAAFGMNRGDNIVYYDIHIKDSGRTEPDLSNENDVHGIQISRSNIWILDSLIHDSAGDSIQINGEFAQGIYIGRNKLHSDNENAMDFKRRYDMMFVENDVWDYRGIAYQSSGSDGVPVIVNQDTSGQDPTRSTIARNRIWDANGAIRHQGHNIWTVDNVIWNIHHNTNNTASSYAVQVGSIYGDDYTDRIMNNSMSKIDAGVRIWANVNNGIIDHQYKGNVFGVLNANSLEKLHFRITSNHVVGTVIDYNNYAEPALIEWGSTSRDLDWMRINTSSSMNSSQNRDPMFNSEANFDLSLQANSPLINDNIEHSAYMEFFNEYGTSIRFDVNNNPRPQGGAPWAIGAYEEGLGLIFKDGFD